MSIFGKVFSAFKGGVSGFFTGGPLGAVGGAVRGLTGSQTNVIPGKCPSGFTRAGNNCIPSTTTIPSRSGGAPPGAGFTSSGGCKPGLVWDPGLQACVAPNSTVGVKALDDQFGEAVMGRYGAALVPGNRNEMVAICPKGTVLGKDELCYNKRDLKNSERKWPQGRKPLLTGGDMRAISTASAAGKRLEKKTKQLQKLGLMKKPARRSTSRAVAAGHHSHLHHD